MSEDSKKMKFEELSKILLSSSDVEELLQTATIIRERIEIVHTADFKNFLGSLFPCFQTILSTKIRPQFVQGPENKLRHTILEILNRLPNNDVLRPYISKLLSLTMEVLSHDNEENGLVCLRIIFDLHKNYRPHLEQEVQPFLELVQTVYRNLPATVNQIFSAPPESQSAASHKPNSPRTPMMGAQSKPLANKGPVQAAKSLQPPGSLAAQQHQHQHGHTGGGAAKAEAMEHRMTAPQPALSKQESFGLRPPLDMAEEKKKTASSQPQVKAMESFKVLTECPLIVMLLFQLYQRYIHANVPQLIPLMMAALSLRPPENAYQHHQSRYKDLIACQVKTLSFLTYLLRVFTALMQPFEDQLTGAVVKMLRACPGDAVASRKELLVATRHILATEFRKGFFAQVDILLDEKVLIGAGRQAHATLRPLAYSTLADLVHHVRNKLNLSQLSRVIHTFSRNIHDSTLPVSMQSTSVKLLLNLLDYIFQNKEQDGRIGKMLLLRILQPLVYKFKTLQAYIPQVEYVDKKNKDPERDSKGPAHELEEELKKKKQQLGIVEETKEPPKEPPKEQKKKEDFSPEKAQEKRELEATMALRRSFLVGPPMITDSLKDVQSLLKTMVFGLKTVIWCVCNYRRDSLPSHHSTQDLMSASSSNEPYIMTTEERDLVSKFFEWGIPCCALYLQATDSNPHISNEVKKEILDCFAAAFTVLEPFNFRNTVGIHLPLLLDNLMQQQALLAICQQFLANSTASYTFADCLLDFLVNRLDQLAPGQKEKHRFGKSPKEDYPDDDLAINRKREREALRASVLLRLFKIVFGSVTLFPENEAVLRPHLQPLILLSLRYASRVENPVNYYFLMRALFRQISGGKFEASYKEIVPVLQPLLSTISKLHERTEEPLVKNILVELSLSLPSRLSSLLPHLPLLTRLMVHALRSKGELAALGLRSLEFWIDNLNPDFLYPVLEQDPGTLSRIMTALCDHLKPIPYPYGMLALRLLGKMGGRNRRFLKETIAAPTGAMYAMSAPRQPSFYVELEWNTDSSSTVPARDGNTGATAAGGKPPNVCLPLDRAVDRVCSLLERFCTKALNDAAALRPSTLAATSRPGKDKDLDDPLAPAPLPKFSVVEDPDLQNLESPRQLLKTTLDREKRMAYDFVLACLHLLLESESALYTSLFSEERTEMSEQELLNKPAEFFPGLPMPGSIAGADKLQHRRVMASRLFRALLFCAADPEMGKEVKPVIEGFVLHLRRTTSPTASIFSKVDLSSVQDSKPESKLAALNLLNAAMKLNQCAVAQEFAPIIVMALVDPRQPLNDVGLWMLHLVMDATKSSERATPNAQKFGGEFHGLYLLDAVIKQICEACYEKRWRTKMGGCRGLKEVAKYLEFDLLVLYDLKIVSALFFILKDHPRELTTTTVEEVRHALSVYFVRAYGTRRLEDAKKDQPSLPRSLTNDEEQLAAHEGEGNKSNPLNLVSSNEGSRTASPDVEMKGLSSSAGLMRKVPHALLELLAGMVTSSSQSARSTCKSLIYVLASRQDGQDITESDLMWPVRSQISSVIFAKAIRLLQPPQQIGVLEGLTHCLSINGKALIGLEAEEATRLLELLTEVLKLTEPELPRQTNIVQEVLNQRRHKHGRLELLSVSELHATVQLRISAVRMMHALLANPSPLVQNHPGFPAAKERIVSLFFKCLTSQPEQVVDAAQVALMHVILSVRQQKDKMFPKEQLQSCLRPVLVNLADFRKLNLPLLQGLSRLLYLLSNYFNVTLGEKLLEHLRQWLDHKQIQGLSYWRKGEEPEVAAAIVGLFSLLPSSGQFLRHLVDVTIQLERVLPKYQNFNQSATIFRDPLAAAFNRYCQEAVDHFLWADRLLDRTHSDLFLSLLSMKKTWKLRAKLGEHDTLEKLLTVTLGKALAAAQDGRGGGPPGSPNAKAPGPSAASASQVAVSQQQSAAANHAAAQAAAQAKRAHDQAQQAFTQAKMIQHQYTQAQQGSGGSVEQLKQSLQQAQKLAQQAGIQAQQAAKVAKQQAQVAQEKKEQAEASSGAASGLGGKPLVLNANDLEHQHVGLKILHVLVKFDRTFLNKNPKVYERLRVLWRSLGRQQRIKAEESMPPRLQQESKLLVGLMMAYYRHDGSENRVDFLFDMLSIFLQQTCVDFTFLKDFYHHEVPKITTMDQKRKIFTVFLRILQDPKLSQELKIRTLQVLVLPLLFATFNNPKEENTEAIDPESIKEFIQRALNQAVLGHYSENLRIELLKLSTLLIEHLGGALVEHRKELIKFAWNHLKFDESSSKYWAYCNVCRFIACYEPPPKIILQVYVALLRTYQPEARDLVKTALDILVPVLPERLQMSDFIKVIKWTKKIMYEEGHALPQLIHMWQLLVGHAVLFYPYRAQFVPLMVNSLNRLGLPPNCPTENRQLACSLAKLIISWEKYRLEKSKLPSVSENAEDQTGPVQVKREPEFDPSETQESQTKKVKTEYMSPKASEKEFGKDPGSTLSSPGLDSTSSPLPSASPAPLPGQEKTTGAGSSQGGQAGGGSITHLHESNTMKEIVVNFLVRMGLVLANNKEPENLELSKKCVDLLKESLDLWPQTSIKFHFFDKLLENSTEIPAPQSQSSRNSQKPTLTTQVLKCTADILTVSLQQPKEGPVNTFFIENLPKILHLIRLCFKENDPALQHKVCLLLIRVFDVYPPDTSPDTFGASGFYNTLRDLLEKQLAIACVEVKDTGAGMHPPNTSAYGVVQVITHMAKRLPSMAECHGPSLVKLAQHLTRHHLQQGREKKIADINAQKVLPMPLLAVIHEAVASDPPRPEPIPENHHCLAFILRLLTKFMEGHQTPSVMAGAAAGILLPTTKANLELKKALFQVFSHLLEGSDSIPLLSVVVRIVGKWLVAPFGPLGQSEKSTVLARLVGFDRLNEVHAQPIQAMVLDILLKLNQGFSSQQAGHDQLPIRKIFSLGLLSPNPAQRKKFLDHFLVGVGSSPQARLQHIFQSNWEYLKNRYWLVVATEVVLLAFKKDTPSVLHGAAMSQIDNPFDPSPEHNTYQTFLDLLTKTGSAGGDAGEGGRRAKHLLCPLAELGHADLALGALMWELVTKAAWGALPAAEQTALVPHIVQLLARPDHKPALFLPPYLGQALPLNVVQSLLNSFFQLRPIPLIPVDLLAVLTINYSCWYLVVPVVEHLVVTCLAQERANHVRVLGFLYRELNEQDLFMGLCRRISAVKDTKVALSLEAYGYTKEAQQVYHATISRENSGATSVAVSQLELELWEERWLRAAENLGQWPTLKDFASALQQPELMLSAAWKNKEWDLVKNLLQSNATQSLKDSGSPQFKLYETYLSITEGKVGTDVERSCATAVQLALAQWQQLPSVHTASQAHCPLLHLFHQIVEVRESSSIMLEVQTHSRSGRGRTSYPDFKSILSTWRERLPNKWDDIKDWDDLLAWRQQIFYQIASTFRSADPSHLACLHDTPWTVVKLAHTARKQKLLEVCLQNLSKLYTVATMDVQDAFEKLREQIIICHTNPTEHRGGLNIINNTNLDYFNSNQKAELFRLKGLFLGALGAVTDANHAYSHAMQICGTYAKGWHSWARYCDSIFLEQRKVHYGVQAMACYLQAVLHGCEGARLSLGRVLWMLAGDDEKQTLARTLENYGQALPEWVWLLWIPQLLTALGRPEAMSVKSLVRSVALKYPQAVYYTLRAFLLERRELPGELSKKGHTGTTSSTDDEEQSLSGNRSLVKVEGGGRATPTSQGAGAAQVKQEPLSSTNTRAGMGTGASMKAIKVDVGSERGGNTGSSGGNVGGLASPKRGGSGASGGGDSSGPVTPTAATHTEEIMATIRRVHPLLGLEMEMVLEELIVHFRPNSDEELLSAVHTLLIKCFQLVHMSLGEPMPTSLGATLQRVCKKFFFVQNHKSERNKAFVEVFRDQFRRDFDFEGGSGGARLPSLQTVVHRLKKWKHILQVRILRSTQQQVPMHEYSAYLAQVNYEPSTWNPSSRVYIEIPGYYNTYFREPRPDLHPKILQFQSHAGIQHRYGFSQRRIGICANDGQVYRFLVQFALPHVTRTDERVMQLHQMMKQLVERGKQSMRRHINLTIPIVVPVTPRMRLMEDQQDYISLGEIYELDRMAKNLDPDYPILLSRERISNAINSARNSGGENAAKQAEREMKIIVFKEVCEKHVQTDILARYLQGCLGDAEAVWAYQKAFAIQLASASLSCYLLACGERVAHRLVLGRQTARVVCADFRPGYNHQGLLDTPEEVKFRLTRNLSTMLSRFLIDGIFATTMAAISLSLSQKADVFRPYLSLMIRDDLLSWHASKTQPRSEIEQRHIEQQLSERVEKDVQKVLERVHCLSPNPGEFDPQSKQPIPIDVRVHDLIEAAENSANLAQMNPTWMPWL